mmetsp:Transcript_12220/g.26353  ORF Transcript_12220/g.26353 Transcript_12220/m.26353 type:complete len:425 (+) Transcript_12220:304-1578(+)
MIAASSLSRHLCSTSKRLSCSSNHVLSTINNGNFFAYSSSSINNNYHLQTHSQHAFSSNAGTDDNDSTTPQRNPINVSFVGLGNMGLQMALNLAAPKGEAVDDSLPPMHFTVYDLQESNVSKFMEQHATTTTTTTATKLSVASTLSSVGESSPDFVVTSLPTCEASEAVVGDIVANFPASIPNNNETNDDHNSNSKTNKCIFIDTSTISPNISKKLHQLVTTSATFSPHNQHQHQQHHDYVDAPVSGGVKGATDATLTFMVGCSSPTTFTAIQPLLRRMGKSVIPCGEAGSGSAVKLCNNAALAAQMVGICEAMNLGDALGVDPTVLAGAMNISTAKCWSSEVNNPHPTAARELGSGASADGYEGGFGTALMLKDLNLAVDAGEEEGLALPVAGLSRDLYRMADLHGYGRRDFGVMLEFLKGVK